MLRAMDDERRLSDQRPTWAWSGDLRDAYRTAVSTVLDPKAEIIAQAPVAARPAPFGAIRRLSSPGR
jgi:hypothetical protein